MNLEEARKLADLLRDGLKAYPDGALLIHGFPVKEAARYLVELADEVERLQRLVPTEYEVNPDDPNLWPGPPKAWGKS